MHLLFSFCHIYCYTDKFRQLFVTTFVYRVNSVWGDELDSLGCGRLAHKVLIVDCTKLKRKFARSNRIPLTDCRCGYRRDNSRGKDEKFPYRSGPKWYEPFCVLSKELGPEVRRATESCSPMEPGTVVVKSNDGLESLDRDSYRDDQYWDSQELQFPSQLMDLALGYQKADRLVFLDSILPDINILEFLHIIHRLKTENQIGDERDNTTCSLMNPSKKCGIQAREKGSTRVRVNVLLNQLTLS